MKSNGKKLSEKKTKNELKTVDTKSGRYKASKKHKNKAAFGRFFLPNAALLKQVKYENK